MVNIERALEEHLEVANKLDGGVMRNIYMAIENITWCLRNGGRILVCGNGGSAADATHITGELVGRYKKERSGFDCIDLTAGVAHLTAIGNDYGFKCIFERGVEAHAKKGDILWGISTSGNSENIIRAFNKGKKMGTYNFSLTGKDGGQLKKISKLNIHVPSDNTPRIQEMHMFIYHEICGGVEAKLVEEQS